VALTVNNRIFDKEHIEHELNHLLKVLRTNGYEDKQFEEAVAKARRGPHTRQLE
jgi:hypothetical protein